MYELNVNEKLGNTMEEQHFPIAMTHLVFGRHGKLNSPHCPLVQCPLVNSSCGPYFENRV